MYLKISREVTMGNIEKKNLLEFLAENEIEKICIPKIQREYVQGQNERGEKFVKDIFENLKKNETMTLVLIYGSLEKGVFNVIDGQQRLTTLFLLYWYIYMIEKPKNTGCDVKECLKKFTYDTRESSKKFVAELCDKIDADFTMNNDDIPSQKIKTAYWYYEKYKCDYTINSMLGMLDMIQRQYKICVDHDPDIKLFDRLKNILFYQCEFDEYTLGGELYIIMNDRGKALCPYENIKSSLLGWIRSKATEAAEATEAAKATKAAKDLGEAFDNTYSERIWESLSDKAINDRNNTTDAIMYQFFVRFLWILGIAECDKKKIESCLDKIDDVIQSEIKCSEIEEIDFKDFFEPVLDSILKADPEFYNNMKSFLDAFFKEKNKDIIKDYYKKDNVTVGLFSEKDYSLPVRVADYGLYLYIINNKNKDAASWKEWKRFCFNIIEDTRASESIANVATALRILQKYSKNTDDILTKLVETYKNEAYEYESEEREARKAKYIKDVINGDKAWRAAFDDAEAHPFLKGYVDFAIDKTLDELDETNKTNDTNDEFVNRWKRVCMIFPKEEKAGFNKDFNKEDDYLMLRALLSEPITKKNAEKGVTILNNDNGREGITKTSIKNYWAKILSAEYIYNTDINNEQTLVNKMKEACNSWKDKKDKYPSQGESDPFDENDEFVQLQYNLCTNGEFMKWIQKIGYDRKTSIILANKGGARVYFGQNSGNYPYIWHNKDFGDLVHGLSDAGYNLKDFDNKTKKEDMCFDLGSMHYYITRGAVYLKKGNAEDAKDIKVNYDLKISVGDTKFQKEDSETVSAYLDRIKKDLKKVDQL